VSKKPYSLRFSVSSNSPTIKGYKFNLTKTFLICSFVTRSLSFATSCLLSNIILSSSFLRFSESCLVFFELTFFRKKSQNINERVTNIISVFIYLIGLGRSKNYCQRTGLADGGEIEFLLPGTEVDNCNIAENLFISSMLFVQPELKPNL